MKLLKFISRPLPASGLALIAALSLAQAQQPQPAPQDKPQQKEYMPSVGQEGKDVVWVPTNQAMVDKMLDMAKVTADDFVMDLGSGDGRTVITAAKRGAKATGIEYNPDMVELSKRNAAKEGVSDRATFMKADIYKTDFSKATVITMFLLPRINVDLRPKILDMKPGTRVVSNSFDMGDWNPDDRANVTNGCTSYCTALFWIVPAKVQGTWKLDNGELTLEQKYQMLTGTLKTGKTSASISNAKMTGDQIEFTVGNTRYTGKVSGSSMDGTAKSETAETKWHATLASDRRKVKGADKKKKKKQSAMPLPSDKRAA